MRITEKTYPYLNDLMWTKTLLENPVFLKTLRKMNPTQRGLLTEWIIGVDGADEDRESAFRAFERLSDRWPVLSRSFRSDVCLVSQEFMLAVMECSKAFSKAEESCREHLCGKTFAGTQIIPSFGMFLSYHVVYDDEGHLDFMKSSVLELDSHGSIVIFKDADILFVSNSFKLVNVKTNRVKKLGAGIDRSLEAFDFAEDYLTSFFLFCRYADVVSRLVPRVGSREAQKCAGNPDAMTSACQLPLRRLFADYYTDIIREEGFSVRGHFRLQPCGPLRGEHKLIYIKPYEKHGYFRRAKIRTIK